ncbi:ribbon-helix-helix DNA binding domain protein [Arthrobacter phage Tillums]|nr:ribbon-helix-helix DNA binding domain protein [Arthrobacter phage Tillums]
MEKPKRGRGKQVSATVAPELFTALEDHAWENRRQRTDVVRQAVEEYAQRNGIWAKNEWIIDSPDENPEQDNEVHHEA